MLPDDLGTSNADVVCIDLAPTIMLLLSVKKMNYLNFINIQAKSMAEKILCCIQFNYHLTNSCCKKAKYVKTK